MAQKVYKITSAAGRYVAGIPNRGTGTSMYLDDEDRATIMALEKGEIRLSAVQPEGDADADVDAAAEAEAEDAPKSKGKKKPAKSDE